MKKTRYFFLTTLICISTFIVTCSKAKRLYHYSYLVFSFIKQNCSPGGMNAILEFHVTQKYNRRYLVKYNFHFQNSTILSFLLALLND